MVVDKGNHYLPQSCYRLGWESDFQLSISFLSCFANASSSAASSVDDKSMLSPQTRSSRSLFMLKLAPLLGAREAYSSFMGWHSILVKKYK